MIGLKFECQVAVCINVHLHGFDVFGEELISFRGCHFHASDFQCFVEHVIYIESDSIIDVLIHSFEDRAMLHIFCVTGIEVIDVAVEYTCVHESVLEVGAATISLYHYQESRIGERFNKPPEVRVA